MTLREHGLTEATYSKLAQGQDYKCAICKLPKRGGRGGNLYVDHDHRSGIIRGLLCAMCNSGLGSLKDNIPRMENAIQYLKHHAKLKAIK